MHACCLLATHVSCVVIARKQAVCTWEFVWDSAGGGPLEREDEHAPSVATGFFVPFHPTCL